MGESVATVKCGECGSVMYGRKGEYKYSECGLSSVVLKDILVYRCENCSEVISEIPAVGVLHWVIAKRLLCKRAKLTGSEIRYLRKFCGYSVKDFAEIMGSSRQVISRWETGEHGESTDRVVRLLVLAKMCREITGKPDRILKNITVDQLNDEVEQALKMIDAKAKDERYEIPFSEVQSFSGDMQDTPEPSGAKVN